jgi:outer membrane protein assembly factor BamB
MRFRLLIVVGLLGVVSPLMASANQVPSAEWPMYQYSPDRNAAFDNPGWTANWTFDAGGKINGGISIVGTTLYVESFKSALYAIDAQTGKELWHQPLPNMAMNTPIVADGVVVAGTGTNQLLLDNGREWLAGNPSGDEVAAFNAATGQPVWTFKTVGQDMPTGAVVRVGSIVEFVFASGDGYLYALNIDDGHLLWRTPMNGIDMMSSLSVAGDLVYGVSCIVASPAVRELQLPPCPGPDYTHCYRWSWAIDAENGQQRWSAPWGLGDGTSTLGDGEFFAEGITFSAGALAGKEAPHNHGSSEVAALDSETGRLLWKFQAPMAEIGPSGEMGIAGLYRAGIFYESLPHAQSFDAFDARTGRVLWSVGTHGYVKMSAVLSGGVLYFGDMSGYLYAVRARDGIVLDVIKFNQEFQSSAPVVVGHTLYIANGSSVYAISVDDVLAGYVNRFQAAGR